MHKEWAEVPAAYFKEFFLWFVNIFLKEKKNNTAITNINSRSANKGP